MLHSPKRLLFGRALRTDRLGETLRPSGWHCRCSAQDPLSSVAYETDRSCLSSVSAGSPCCT